MSSSAFFVFSSLVIVCLGYEFVSPLSDFVITDFRSINGSDNNPNDFSLGSTFECLISPITSSGYEDLYVQEVIDRNVSARKVSNIISNVPDYEQDFNDRGLSNLFWVWGQFVDHDLMESLVDTKSEVDEKICIDIPEDDPFFDLNQIQCLTIRRHEPCGDSGASVGIAKKPHQRVTSYLDASTVYGSEEERTEELRLHEHGLLKTQTLYQSIELAPNNENMLPEGGGANRTELFIFGDVRGNENLALQWIHTLMVLEHNRIATEIYENNGCHNLTDHECDEEIFELSRAIVGGIVQKITYQDWLPSLYGTEFPEYFEPYSGYDDTCDPTPSVLFSTVALRVGHTLLPNILQYRTDECEISCDSNNNDDYTANNINGFPLAQSYFNQFFLRQYGIDSLFLGLSCSLAKEIDNFIVDGVRNFLFHGRTLNKGFHGLDLLALNIERGRELGLPDFNTIRRDFGLDEVDFADFIDGDAIEEAYSGDLDNIDPWVGAISEAHLADASVGEFLAVALAEQFLRTRNCDRFWYRRYFSGELLNYIEERTLADIIIDNTDINNMQENVFFIPNAGPNGKGKGKAP